MKDFEFIPYKIRNEQGFELNILEHTTKKKGEHIHTIQIQTNERTANFIETNAKEFINLFKKCID